MRLKRGGAQGVGINRHLVHPPIESPVAKAGPADSKCEQRIRVGKIAGSGYWPGHGGSIHVKGGVGAVISAGDILPHLGLDDSA